jgi:hypothetical protein
MAVLCGSRSAESMSRYCLPVVAERSRGEVSPFLLSPACHLDVVRVAG